MPGQPRIRKIFQRSNGKANRIRRSARKLGLDVEEGEIVKTGRSELANDSKTIHHGGTEKQKNGSHIAS